MTTRTAVIGAGVIAVVTAGALLLKPKTTPTANTPVPADICTGPYFYQIILPSCDMGWQVGWPGLYTPGEGQGTACTSHAKYAYGETGRMFIVVPQTHGNPGPKYAKPPQATDPGAYQIWKNCYAPVTPEELAKQQSYRNAGYTLCGEGPAPIGTQNPLLVPLASVSDPAKKAAWSATFHCNVSPTAAPPTSTPVPTAVPPGTTPVCTVTPKPCCNTPTPKAALSPHADAVPHWPSFNPDLIVPNDGPSIPAPPSPYAESWEKCPEKLPPGRLCYVTKRGQVMWGHTWFYDSVGNCIDTSGANCGHPARRTEKIFHDEDIAVPITKRTYEHDDIITSTGGIVAMRPE